MPSLRFDPSLIESVVTAAAALDAELARAYHRRANPLYETLLLDERETAFDQLHAQLFVARGYSEWFAALFAELPALQQRAPSLLVLAARLAPEEGAVVGRDGQSVCLRITPERFAKREPLSAFVRHELLHAADMFDETFGYPQDNADRPYTSGAANALAERYRVLWCAYVDARLVRRGVAPLTTVESHRRAFEQGLGAPAAAFERIWNAQALSHADLMALARAQAERRIGPKPGARCPLCNFPTHQWAREIAEPVAALIRADFAAWQADDGACERCAERYAFLAQAPDLVGGRPHSLREGRRSICTDEK